MPNLPKKRSYLTNKTLVLAAGAEVTLNLQGEFFRVKEATADFAVQLGDDMELLPIALGMEVRLDDGDLFTKIRIVNTSAAANTITFYCGAGKISDQRFNVVRTSVLPVRNQDEPTLLNTNTQNLGAGASTLYPGVLNAGGKTRRKSFIITNLDAANSLTLQTNASGTFGTVFPLQIVQINTDDSIRVRNNTGAVISYQVGELFYTV